MSQPEESDDSKKMGRPEWVLKIERTPEELAQAIFANADPPDPSIRVRNRENEEDK